MIQFFHRTLQGQKIEITFDEVKPHMTGCDWKAYFNELGVRRKNPEPFHGPFITCIVGVFPHDRATHGYYTIEFNR